MDGPFEVIESIGAGGMGHVWRARDRETGNEIAVKVIHAYLLDEPHLVARFLREAQLAGRPNSPHVVRVLGQGTANGAPYMAMELVTGGNLRQVIKDRGTLPPGEAMALARQLVAGLASVHAAGIVHRDLKPSNVLLTHDGILKIADFGIASAFDVTRITLTDQTLGTPHYTAPEGQRDERSDLYSVGCMIYEMLAGVPPFEGSSQQEVIRKHINEPVDFGRIPADCRPLLRWLLDKRADQRPRSASHLLRVLDGIEPVPALAVRACPYCEAEIGVDARKCRYCGEWVADRPEATGLPTRAIAPAPPAPPPPALGVAAAAPVLAHAVGLAIPPSGSGSAGSLGPHSSDDRPSPADMAAAGPGATGRTVSAGGGSWRNRVTWLVLAGGTLTLVAFFFVPGNTDTDPNNSVYETLNSALDIPSYTGITGEAARLVVLWLIIPIAAASAVGAGLLAGSGRQRLDRSFSRAVLTVGAIVISANAVGFVGLQIALHDSDESLLFVWLTGLWDGAPAFPLMTAGGLLVLAGGRLAYRGGIANAEPSTAA